MPRVTRPAPALAAPALLRLMWLASPALPVGAFSYSEGLEAAVEAGAVRDERSAAAWLRDQLTLVQQRAELPLVAAAWRAWSRKDLTRARELNDWQRVTRESSEMRLQTEQMGRSLVDWLRQRLPDDRRVPALAAFEPAPTWPLAWALAAQAAGVPLREALFGYGFGWAEAMTQAAIKAVPLGQNGGQRLLSGLAEALPDVIDAALAIARRGDAARFAFAPMLAILSARHEAQYSRLFRS